MKRQETNEVLVRILVPETESEVNRKKIIDFVQRYIAMYGFFVFAHDKEITNKTFPMYTYDERVNRIRLALLYALSYSSYLLFKGLQNLSKLSHEDLSKLKTIPQVVSQMLRIQKDQKDGWTNQDIKSIETLLAQLLPLCKNSLSEIVTTLVTQFNYEDLIQIDQHNLLNLLWMTHYPKYNVILFLDSKTQEYLGHIMEKDPGGHQKICDIIGIRQSFSNALRRNQKCMSETEAKKNKGVDRIAYRFLEQVKSLCEKQGGSEIRAMHPYGRMPAILEKCGFYEDLGNYTCRLDRISPECGRGTPHIT
jgi:hypothetical protein